MRTSTGYRRTVTYLLYGTTISEGSVTLVSLLERTTITSTQLKAIPARVEKGRGKEFSNASG